MVLGAFYGRTTKDIANLNRAFDLPRVTSGHSLKKQGLQTSNDTLRVLSQREHPIKCPKFHSGHAWWFKLWCYLYFGANGRIP